jgi:hypothetical protein
MVTCPLDIPTGKSGIFEVDESLIEGCVPALSLREAILTGRPQVKVQINPPGMRVVRLKEGKRVWMSNHPQEVYSHYQCLTGLKGHVLVGGLGLGMAVKLLRKNPAVTKITVVERSQDVINLVAKYVISPPDEVVCADLFKYLRECKKEKAKFDSAYYDIWQADSEHTFSTLVHPLRLLSNGVVPWTDISCWMEASMLGQVRMGLTQAVVFWQMLDSNVGLDFPDIRTVPDERWPETAKAVGPKAAFFNWVRKEHPAVTEAQKMIEPYIFALQNPKAWNRTWKKWTTQTIKKGSK